MTGRSIGGNYWQTFSTNAWRYEDGIYKMTVSNDVHGLGYSCHFNITRYDNGAYKPVALHYEIDGNGNITVFSAQAFSGVYYVVSGV